MSCASTSAVRRELARSASQGASEGSQEPTDTRHAIALPDLATESAGPVAE